MPHRPDCADFGHFPDHWRRWHGFSSARPGADKTDGRILPPRYCGQHPLLPARFLPDGSRFPSVIMQPAHCPVPPLLSAGRGGTAYHPAYRAVLRAAPPHLHPHSGIAVCRRHENQDSPSGYPHYRTAVQAPTGGTPTSTIRRYPPAESE